MPRKSGRRANCCESRWPIVSSRSGASIPMIRKRCGLPPESIDLALSALAFQFVNDLPGVLAQIRRALRPDGLLLAAMIGGDTLTELRQAFARSRGRMRRRRVAARRAVCRSARCRQPVAARGLCAAGHRRRSHRGALRQCVRADGRSAADGRDQYHDRAAADADAHAPPCCGWRRSTRSRFSDPDGRIRATFDIIWLSGWAPHESQPKPLRPGSAKASLEAAVKRTPK